MARTVYYHGHSVEGVDAVMPDGSRQHVPWGGGLATTDEHADLLLEQEDNWRKTAPRNVDPADHVAKRAEQAERAADDENGGDS